MGDGFGPVGRQLRQGVGAELRAEAEETERLVALAARRRRSLADVAADLLARGDTVAVDVPGRRFTGTVVQSAADLLRLRTVGGPVDVPLRGPVTLTVVDRALAGGVDRPDGPTSFRSRLLELELEGVAVEVGDAAAGTVVGRLAAIARDHAIVVERDGTERYVSLAGITYVRAL